MSNIVRLKRSQIEPAIAVLSRAFADDPLLSYFLPETEKARAKAIRQFYQTILYYCEPYNHIYTTAEDLRGVAIWLPPGQFPYNSIRLLQAGMYKLPFLLRWRRLRQFISLFFRLEEYHKHDVSQQHWYLSVLGVMPAYQNQGIGSLLLQPILQQSDRERLPCYLEATTENNVRFYQKHGFEIIRIGELPGGNPRFWTMKREPSTTAQKSKVQNF